MCYTYDAQSRVTKRTVIALANNTSKDEVFASVGTAIASGLGTVIGLAAGLFVGCGERRNDEFCHRKSRFEYAIYYRFFTDSKTTICISLIYL